MLHFLPTVRFKGLQACMVPALLILKEEFDGLGKDLWITSCNDGMHKGGPIPGGVRDPHYEGLALDIRSHDLGPGAPVIAMKLKVRLDPEYDVLFEDQGKPNEHFHIQYRSLK